MKGVFDAADSRRANGSFTGEQHCGIQGCQSAPILYVGDDEDDRRGGVVVNHSQRVLLSARAPLTHAFRVADVSYKVFFDAIEAQGCTLSRVPLVQRSPCPPPHLAS